MNQTKILSNEIAIPTLGFGTFKIDDAEVERLVTLALEAGYRHIDTATLYHNEKGVGRALKQTDIKRDAIFLTTKVANDDQGYDETLKAVNQSLQDLQTDYLDLLLIHWPNPKSAETWRAMEDLYFEGKLKAIGVSNFHQNHLEKLLKNARVVPMVNQIERHPYLTQNDLWHYCRKHNIMVQAWSPLAKGEVLHEVILHKIAHKYDVSVAQVVLRWQVQSGWLVVVKSSFLERMISNLSLDGFSLTVDEMELIESLNKFHRTGSNPDNFEF